MCDGSVTEDGKYLIVGVSKGCDPTNQIYFYDLQAASNKIEKKLTLSPLFTKFDVKCDFVDNHGESALLLTNHNSPMLKLIRVKMNSNAENPSMWETVVEEDPKRKLEWVAPVAGNKMVVSSWRMSSLLSMCMIWKPAGCFIRFRFQLARFESFLTPTIIYQADFSKCRSSSVPIQLKEIKKTKIAGSYTKAFNVKQEFYTSKIAEIVTYTASSRELENRVEALTVRKGLLKNLLLNYKLSKKRKLGKFDGAEGLTELMEEFEQENLRPRSWELSGEIFELNQRQSLQPILPTLESIVLRRIKESKIKPEVKNCQQHASFRVEDVGRLLQLNQNPLYWLQKNFQGIQRPAMLAKDERTDTDRKRERRKIRRCRRTFLNKDSEIFETSEETVKRKS
uniref:Peptidase S9A N-terminal domain-containing protein n=1 Tax=Ditylenchus dipsaci TaxID=166011 RepID=A0A915EK70_9BILA